jgi:hypothetical protein
VFWCEHAACHTQAIPQAISRVMVCLGLDVGALFALFISFGINYLFIHVEYILNTDVFAFPFAIVLPIIPSPTPTFCTTLNITPGYDIIILLVPPINVIIKQIMVP